jgi:hypothetical protein
MEYSIADLLNSCVDEDHAKIQDAVDHIMKERLADALSKQKIEVAQNLFKSKD